MPVNCNSLLHRSLYQELKERNRDLILKIAQKSSQFSISNIFLSQTDVECVLLHASAQVLKVFDEALEETIDTRKVDTLDISNDLKIMTFTSEVNELSQQKCNKKVEELLQSRGIAKENFTMSSVKVQKMNLKWLKTNGKLS